MEGEGGGGVGCRPDSMMTKKVPGFFIVMQNNIKLLMVVMIMITFNDALIKTYSQKRIHTSLL